MMEITVRCPFCGKINTLEVDENAYYAWQSGELIQNAFPTMSADDRELIKTGICADCWSGMFPPEEEDCDGNCKECGKCAEWEDEVNETGFDPYEGCYTYDC